MGISSKPYGKVLPLCFVSPTVADKIPPYLGKYKQKCDISLGICPIFANNPIEKGSCKVFFSWRTIKL